MVMVSTECKVKYSIIIPAYNVEKYIERSIRSVMEQRVTNYECIIVNDGSTDATLEIVKNIIAREKRFKVITQENKGLSAARNTAIKNACGRYLIFLDSDDYLPQDALSIIDREMEPNDEVVIFDYYKFVQGQNELHKVNCNIDSLGMDKKAFLEECLSDKFYLFTVWRVVISRAFLEKNQLWFYEGIIHEDELWTIKSMVLSDKTRLAHGAIYCYGLGRDGTLSNLKVLKELKDLWLIIQELQAFADKIETESHDMAVIIRKRCSQLYYVIIRKFCQYGTANDLEEFEKVIRQNLSILGKNKKSYWLCKIFGISRASFLLDYIHKIREKLYERK